MSLPDSIDSGPRRVLVLMNPRAGRRSVQSQVNLLKELLDRRGIAAEISTDRDAAAERAGRLQAAGELRAVVGVGGDGTAADLVNRMPAGVPMTLLPAGTANLVAQQFGLSSDPEQLCRTIVAGRTLQLDVGQANGKLFLVMFSCGLDAEVVRLLAEQRESSASGGHISLGSYLKPICKAVRTYPYPELQARCEGPCAVPVESPGFLAARWAFAFNLPRYGWGLPLAPAADATDGLLDLCCFARGSLLNGLRYLVAAQLGRHPRLSDCTCCRVRRLRITSDEPVPFQLDGDPGGMLPVEIGVLPGRWTLLVP